MIRDLEGVERLNLPDRLRTYAAAGVDAVFTLPPAEARDWADAIDLMADIAQQRNDAIAEARALRMELMDLRAAQGRQVSFRVAVVVVMLTAAAVHLVNVLMAAA